MPTSDAPRLSVRPAEAAARLGLCRATVYNMMTRGELKSVTIGRARLIPISELERVLAVDPVS